MRECRRIITARHKKQKLHREAGHCVQKNDMEGLVSKNTPKGAPVLNFSVDY